MDTSPITITLEETAFDPRRAGLVKRYHTWETLQVQTVAEHSWHVMRILLAIFPDAPRYMLVHCMTHDIGEVVSGDVPYPIKRLYPDMKRACDMIEEMAHCTMSNAWGVPYPVQLTDEERRIFKLAEFLEMWEYGLHEIELGNAIAKLICTRTGSAITELLQQVTDDDVRKQATFYYRQRIIAHKATLERKYL